MKALGKIGWAACPLPVAACRLCARRANNDDVSRKNGGAIKKKKKREKERRSTFLSLLLFSLLFILVSRVDDKTFPCRSPSTWRIFIKKKKKKRRRPPIHLTNGIVIYDTYRDKTERITLRLGFYLWDGGNFTRALVSRFNSPRVFRRFHSNLILRHNRIFLR